MQPRDRDAIPRFNNNFPNIRDVALGRWWREEIFLFMGHIMEISLEQLEKMNSRKNNVDKNVRTLKKRDGRAFTVQVWITSVCLWGRFAIQRQCCITWKFINDPKVCWYYGWQSWKVVIRNVTSFQVQVNVYPNFGLIVRAIFLIPNRLCKKTAIKVSVHCDNNASRKFTHENLNNAQYSATKLGVFLGGTFEDLGGAKANGQPHRWSLEN